MFNWLNASMTRKVSSLSFILLSFLFVVIIYTAYQTQKIYAEMQEVAEIDVPLSELISDIEMLQLKQHLLVETIRQQGRAFFDNEALQAKSVKDFNDFSQRLSVELNKAVNLLHPRRCPHLLYASPNGSRMSRRGVLGVRYLSPIWF
ncbi:hypothetical protein [Marinomonas sp.]|uniref:hypothetical protein n=1 Tax=Marinomonas sp. TaxID=1904862 RepID=UPI003BADBC0E